MISGKFLILNCDSEQKNHEGVKSNFKCFAILDENGMFYGIASDESQEGGDFLVTGYYNKNLGLSLIKLPAFSVQNPELYRTLIDENGSTAGQYYDVSKGVGVLFHGPFPIGVQEMVRFLPKGNAKMQIETRDLDFFSFATIDKTREDYESFLTVQEFRDYYKNSFKDEAAEELKADLEKLKVSQSNDPDEMGW